MLSYRHAFHAGNHADLLKHSVVCNILESLCKKEKPFAVFDTHAGAGLYTLDDERALKTGETSKGILCVNNRLSASKTDEIPESLKSYLEITQKYSDHNLYPGSPEICRIFMNSDCFHGVCELHNTEIEVLTDNLKNTPLITKNPYSPKSVETKIYHADGLNTACTVLPPAVKRGLVLIDPSYEEKTEYADVLKAVKTIHKKWSAAIIAVWIPLLSHRKSEIDKLTDGMIETAKARNQNTEILVADLCVQKEDAHIERSLEENQGAPRLYGSRMVVINMPWHLDTQSQDNLKFLSGLIDCDCPSFSVKLY